MSDNGDNARDDDVMACLGGRVLSYGDMAECVYCGTRVPWDMTEHRFFGFAAGCARSSHNEGTERTP